MTDTKLLYNRSNRRIDHKYGSIPAKATAKLDADYADYLRALLPDDLINPVDATTVFDQVSVVQLAPVESPVDLGDMTVVELRAVAIERGIVIPAGANKAAILELLAA